MERLFRGRQWQDLGWLQGGGDGGRAGLANKQTKHMLRAPGLRGHQAVRSQKKEE